MDQIERAYRLVVLGAVDAAVTVIADRRGTKRTVAEDTLRLAAMFDVHDWDRVNAALAGTP